MGSNLNQDRGTPFPTPLTGPEQGHSLRPMDRIRTGLEVTVGRDNRVCFFVYWAPMIKTLIS